MRDPKPDNITGEKVQRHVFEHHVNWGYVAVAVVALLVLYKIGLFESGTEEELTHGAIQEEETR